MIKIEAICLDIYGTHLASDDILNDFPPRIGSPYFFYFCDKKNIKIIATSDAPNRAVQSDLGLCYSKYPDLELKIERFYDFVQLDQFPKDYKIVEQIHGIPCQNMLVIGDRDADILGAIECSCI